MKRIKQLLLAFLMLFSLNSCGEQTSLVGENSFSQVDEAGDIGSFELADPTNKQVVDEVPSFSWNKAEGATYYTLEIASTPTFISNDSTVVYYKHDYIASNSYTIGANLPQRDVTYYWKVTAHRGANKQVSNSTFTFFLASVDLGEVTFPIGEVADWSVHTQGSPLDLSINDTNFFSNDEESLVLKFKKEDTKTIGWFVATRTVEKDTYGNDSLFLRFFNSGDDSTAYIRLLDNDGEFWRHKIQLANNCKQTCILPFSEFTQDTELVTVANHTFDYYHIKYMEIVFEKTWGDGVCLVSQIKAIKKSSYSNMFLQELNFKDYPTTSWAWENNYNFGTDVSEDGSSYTLHYDQDKNALNEVGMSSKGYGFLKIPLNRFFEDGDMIQFKVKYTGSANGKLSFRLREEDGDLWYYMEAFSLISTDSYTTLNIPYKAFQCSYYGGNGKREFSYITQLQFGLTNMYGTGTLSYKDIKIVYLSATSEIDSGARTIKDDGTIEDFDSYTTPAEPFYQWIVGIDNKDEYIGLDSLKKYGANNTYSGKLTYKSDMAAAVYTLPIKVEKSYNSVSFMVKDQTVKSESSSFSYLTEVSAQLTIGLTLKTNETYTYTISALPKVWTLYTIPFGQFSLSGNQGASIDSTEINYISLGLSYVYKTIDGKESPTYSMLNPVYFDNIKFASSANEEVSIVAKEIAIGPDSEGSTKATIETGEDYSSTSEVLDVWSYGNDNKDNNLELSDEVSANGGNHSLKMNYKSYTSVSYAVPITLVTDFGSSFNPKGVTLDLKGDGKATVYVNLYFLVNGNIYQVRKNIVAPLSSWSTYKIGFDAFSDYKSSSTFTITKATVNYLYKVTFGIVNSDYSSSAVYLDNLAFDNSISRDSYSSSAI